MNTDINVQSKLIYFLITHANIVMTIARTIPKTIESEVATQAVLLIINVEHTISSHKDSITE